MFQPQIFFWLDAVSGIEDGERVFVVASRDEPLFIANMGVSVYTEEMLNKNLINLEGDFYDFLSSRHDLHEDAVGLRLWAVLSSPMTLDHTPYLEMKKYLEENIRQSKRVSLVPYTPLNSKQEIYIRGFDVPLSINKNLFQMLDERRRAEAAKRNIPEDQYEFEDIIGLLLGIG